jgi:hypothetical protein
MFQISPASSTGASPSQPITIGSPSSQFGSPRRVTSPSASVCSFPSWPSGDSLTTIARNNVPSSYISDEDLFPEDLDEFGEVPILLEPPAPPKEIAAVAMPLLPLYASEKPKNKRRRSSRKQPSAAKPMTPIAESPKAPE